ncbi:MAG: DUF1566 domain-containing protein [Thermoanaerobaculia bacterium]
MRKPTRPSSRRDAVAPGSRPAWHKAAERLIRGVATMAALSFGLLAGAAPVHAQSSLSADGLIETSTGGLRFPDGTVQATAAAEAAAPLPDTGQRTCYDSTGSAGAPVPCSATGQDGETQAGVSWGTPRFAAADGTVEDRLTGLVWLQDADCSTFNASLDFADALDEAATLAQGSCGLTDGSVAGDWRVPSIRELLSLVDYSQVDPALPGGHLFENTIQTTYWSSTTYLPDPTRAWVVLLGGEGFDQFTAKDNAATAFLLPVRDAD